MSKMGSNDPFGHLKHKLWPKEGSGVKLPNAPPSSLLDPKRVQLCQKAKVVGT